MKALNRGISRLSSFLIILIVATPCSDKLNPSIKPNDVILAKFKMDLIHVQQWCVWQVVSKRVTAPLTWLTRVPGKRLKSLRIHLTVIRRGFLMWTTQRSRISFLGLIRCGPSVPIVRWRVKVDIHLGNARQARSFFCFWIYMELISSKVEALHLPDNSLLWAAYMMSKYSENLSRIECTITASPLCQKPEFSNDNADLGAPNGKLEYLVLTMHWLGLGL